MWVPKRSTHFMGGQMMPSSHETTPAKFAYRWREFFPSDSFVFSRPPLPCCMDVCKRSLSILSSKVKDAPIRVYQMPENQWPKKVFCVNSESARGAKKELWEFLLNCLTSGQFTGFISSRKIRNEHSSWKLSTHSQRLAWELTAQRWCNSICFSRKRGLKNN